MGANGGVIGALNDSTFSVANGVWRPSDIANNKKRNEWPGSDLYWTNTKALLHFEGADTSTTMTDSSSFAKTYTAAGNAQISTAAFPFGTSSLLLDGTGDYVSTPSSTDLDFGDQSFTVECWIKTTSAVQFDTIMSRNTVGFNPPAWNFMSYGAGAGLIAFYANVTGLGQFNLQSTGAVVNDGNWHHVSINRDGDWWFLEQDFEVVGIRGDILSGTTLGAQTGALVIGGDLNTAGRDIAANFRDVRVTAGICRYPLSFTALTQGLPTKL